MYHIKTWHSKNILGFTTGNKFELPQWMNWWKYVIYRNCINVKAFTSAWSFKAKCCVSGFMFCLNHLIKNETYTYWSIPHFLHWEICQLIMFYLGFAYSEPSRYPKQHWIITNINKLQRNKNSNIFIKTMHLKMSAKCLTYWLDLNLFNKWTKFVLSYTIILHYNIYFSCLYSTPLMP